jgi:hypothetical protein
MDAFTYIKDFFSKSKRGVWAKGEILQALDILLPRYHKESTKKLQEEISQAIRPSQKEA